VVVAGQKKLTLTGLAVPNLDVTLPLRTGYRARIGTA
jgi:hypothetical protein